LIVNQPRGIFSGGGVASHMEVWEQIAPKKVYPVHQSHPHQVAKSLKNGLVL